MLQDLLRYTGVLEIVGDTLKMRVPDINRATEPVRLGDLAIVKTVDGHSSLARTTFIDRDVVTLEVFAGTKGISTGASAAFLGHPMQVAYSENILGRVLDGSGKIIDGGPDLSAEPKVEIGGASVNPVERIVPGNMIRTDVPMIDVFNCLVESQKIPIFSVSGEVYDPFLARIGIQADADIVVFGGLGLMFDDYYTFRQAFEDAGVFNRTVMFINQASDPLVERLLVPDLSLAVAERFAVDEGKRVLVLMTDMTSYADAMKEVGISQERVPSNRGYMGDLYSQLARRYEKACDFAKGGSVTILTVTTMPGNDITHPVPDNTGYITEGQIYLHSGTIDPFGSLSRLKQNVIGKVTREDHGQIMNTMVRFFSESRDAEQKQAMAFDLSDYDHQLLKFGSLFRSRFMDVGVSLPLEDALDLCWATLAECFSRDQLLMRDSLVDKYFPKETDGPLAAQ